jgi:hypothetical protein
VNREMLTAVHHHEGPSLKMQNLDIDSNQHLPRLGERDRIEVIGLLVPSLGVGLHLHHRIPVKQVFTANEA